MFSKIFFVLATLSIAVNAQGSSSSTAPAGIPSFSPCILGCVIPAAAQNGCNGPTDLSCLCSNAQFHVDALGCLTQHCPTEVQAAVTLQQGQCAALSITPTATATPTPRPVSFTSLGAASSTSSTSPSSGSSASKPSGTTSANAGATSTGAGTTLHAGALLYFGAFLAGVLAL